jgi:hypothetical protein
MRERHRNWCISPAVTSHVTRLEADQIAVSKDPRPDVRDALSVNHSSAKFLTPVIIAAACVSVLSDVFAWFIVP